MTLHAMLEAAGHTIVDADPDVILTDSRESAVKQASTTKTLLLTPASGVPDAVRVMRDSGVFGYVFLPLQPGEAAIAVAHAAGSEVETESGADALRSLEDVEMEHIHRVLRACKHNQAKAARVLGIGRNTLWRKLKKHQTTGS
jgi:ActR/RegA family two-component response regulator